LSRARYLFIAQKPEIIADPVCAELRGWRAPDGGQPFWDALGRHFFDMEFEEADVHNSATGNQFIADLMPRYPIYVCLLPEAAVECIGKPHDSALPAYRMLESEGFEYDDYIDIFDGGPLMHAKQQNIRTIYESDVATVKIGEPGDAPRHLLAAGAVAHFRCGAGKAQLEEDGIVIEQAFADALKVEDGDKVRFVPW
jgi:arginine N-succinyltransferase